MAARRSSLELTVEREVVGDDGVARRYRLSEMVTIEPGASAPAPEELRGRYRALSEELDRALPHGAPAAAARPDRTLAALVEPYRPRQRELLDLLRSEGELTMEEFTRLTRYLDERATGSAGEIPEAERPIAAAPIGADRAPSAPRPVAELIRLYQIGSLKQAGAVRARRQISYEEYMALKRHFSPAEPTPDAVGPGGAPKS